MPRSSTAAARTDAVPRWTRRKDARPHELLSAALELFVERGYAATRLDDVAARAGVAKGTLYLYYANKQELFEAVVRETIVARLRDLEDERASVDGGAAAVVRWYFDRWWTLYGSTRASAILKLLIGEANNFPHIARFFRTEVVEPNTMLLARIVADGVAAGEFASADPVMTARIWLGPLVLKSIWMHSFDPVCGSHSPDDLAAFRAAHVEHALASVRPSTVVAKARRR